MDPTREQAIAFERSGVWKSMTDKERAGIYLATDILCVPVDVLMTSLSKVLGFDVYTHHMLAREEICRLLREKGVRPYGEF